MGNESDLTPEELNNLRQEHQSYLEAYKQEFQENAAKEPEEAETYARDFFKKNVPTAAAQIVWLSQNAESEAVKLNAAKTILAEAFANGRAVGDPIKDILTNLTKPSSSVHN